MSKLKVEIQDIFRNRRFVECENIRIYNGKISLMNGRKTIEKIDTCESFEPIEISVKEGGK